MSTIDDASTLAQTVRQAVATTTVSDIHTHLFAPSHGNLLLWGIEEMLTYHYLVAELFGAAPRELTYEKFWAMDKPRQADLVWEQLFLKASPISEARAGVLTILQALGLDPGTRDLAGWRQWFSRQDAEHYLEKVFEIARIDYAIMTNNPLAPAEVEHWQARRPVPRILKTSLRIDALLLDYSGSRAELARQGCRADPTLTAETLEALRRWLGQWVDRINPVYLAASLGPDWHYPVQNETTELLDNVICPLAAERKLPVSLMIGVRKRVNPALGDAGDAEGAADLHSLLRLCRRHGDVKFLSTVLRRDDQHELAVAARKFRNLHVFGCWWFCNVPSIIDEVTRERLELLGTNFTLQHSDARVLDQVIYKWGHTRRVAADILAEKYLDAHAAGWRFTGKEIARDVRQLFGGAFEDYLTR